MLDWFAGTPETFDFTRFFLQLRVKKSAAGAHGSAGRMRNKSSDENYNLDSKFPDSTDMELIREV